MLRHWRRDSGTERAAARPCANQPAAKFGTRYGTLGFQDAAQLDEGHLWPNAYAVTKVGPAERKQIAALLKKASGKG